MGARVVRILTDDFTGEDIPEGTGATFRYSWEGSEWEMDVNDTNAKRVRDTMAGLTEHSRRVGRVRLAQPPRNGTKAAAERKRREIRHWANSVGMDQPMTGKIKDAVYDAWDQAHPDDPAPRPA